MARKKKQATSSSSTDAPRKGNKGSPTGKLGEPSLSFQQKLELLTPEEQALVVEHYLGVHPRFLIERPGMVLAVDIYRMEYEGVVFNGFKNLEER